MRPELGVAAHAEPGPRRPKRVGGLRLDVDLGAEEGGHGDARKQPLVTEHGMAWAVGRKSAASKRPLTGAPPMPTPPMAMKPSRSSEPARARLMPALRKAD